MMRLLVGASLSLLFSSGCAVLYKVQLSDIDAKGKGRPVSVMVSETTVDLREAAAIAGDVGRRFNSRGASNLGNAMDTYTMLFQWGPRTGAPVYSEFYARQIPERLAAECKTGYLTNVSSIRESRDYPLVKGQIVRVDATCM